MRVFENFVNKFSKTLIRMNSTTAVPIIGVLGGVGPMAGVTLQSHIIMNTVATKDPDHLTVIHTCDAQNIADRTIYLTGLKNNADPSTLNNPGIVMANIAINTSQAAKLYGKQCV